MATSYFAGGGHKYPGMQKKKMNSIVGYGDESDDESPSRRRSFVEENLVKRHIRLSPTTKSRRDSDIFDDDSMYDHQSGKSSPEDADFLEPPPPKRPVEIHSPSPAIKTPLGMPRISSTASLVSYGLGGDGENSFEQAEREFEGNTSSHSTPSGNSEPRPPQRVSQESDGSEDDEREIDQILEEANAVGDRDGNSSVGSATPQREAEDSPKTPHEIDEQTQIPVCSGVIAIPPEPEGGVDSKLQERIEMMFKYKQNGVDFNKQIQSRRDFLNPSCYESFIEMFDLDEKETNFRPDIFDPNMFPETCYYDKIGEEQRKLHEHQLHRQRSNTGTAAPAPVAKKPKV